MKNKNEHSEYEAPDSECAIDIENDFTYRWVLTRHPEVFVYYVYLNFRQADKFKRVYEWALYIDKQRVVWGRCRTEEQTYEYGTRCLARHWNITTAQLDSIIEDDRTLEALAELGE